MFESISNFIKDKYDNISYDGYKYTCRAVELLINDVDISIMDIYKTISLESKKTVSGIVKNIRVYKNKTRNESITSKEFIHLLKYDFLNSIKITTTFYADGIPVDEVIEYGNN